MQRHFDADLNKFNAHLLKMATLTENIITKSGEALRTQNQKLAMSVIEEDNEIDNLELSIEEQGIELLALHQPMAFDLRFIMTGIHITADLERISDLAVNIAYKVVELSGMPLLQPLVDIPKLSEMSRRMVKDAIDSFVRRDEQLAKEVIMADTESDQLRNRIVKELIYDYIVKDGTTAIRAIPLLLVARDLERICDHATNIAEDVIYMIQAEFVKHHPEKLQG